LILYPYKKELQLFVITLSFIRGDYRNRTGDFLTAMEKCPFTEAFSFWECVINRPIKKAPIGRKTFSRVNYLVARPIPLEMTE
jgi:hypothetical protein